MGLLLPVFLLSAITQTNKEANKIFFSIVYKLQVYYNTIYNVYKTVIMKMMIITQTIKNYLERAPCTPCGKMTHK